MIIRQCVQQGDGHSFPNYQQQSDGHIMVALVVVQLSVTLQNLQYDVDELLLKHCSLRGWHTCRRANEQCIYVIQKVTLESVYYWIIRVQNTEYSVFYGPHSAMLQDFKGKRAC